MFRSTVIAAGLAASFLTPAIAAPHFPSYYPSDYANLLAAAKEEGKVVVYSSTDTAAVTPLLNGFQEAFGIEVEYVDKGSSELYTRFVSEIAAGVETADVMMAGGGDIASRLVEAGYAAAYRSPEADRVPPEFIWDNRAFGISNEPMVILYNKRLVPQEDVPATHAEFAALLREKQETYRGMVGSYDPEKSGAGFLYFNADTMASEQAWDLIAAMGGAKSKLYTSSGTMIERVKSGEHSFGYNIIGSYIDAAIKAGDKSIGMVVPCDYSIALVRSAIIPEAASRPNAARLFLDYVLSAEGQRKLAEASINPIRDDARPQETIMPSGECRENMRPVLPSAEISQAYSEERRAEFLARWKETF